MENRKKGSRKFPPEIQNGRNGNEGFLGYALKCSLISADQLHLSRLNEAANMRKRMNGLLKEWVQVEAEALFAQWVAESQRLLTEEENRCRSRAIKFKA